MSFKEHLKTMFMNFFIITTLVNLAIFILGSSYLPDTTFSYEAYLSPVIYGIFGTLPTILLYSKKELSAKQLIIRKVFQVLALEILLILITFSSSDFTKENIQLIISFALSVFIIYVLVTLFTWIIDRGRANSLMNELIAYQKNQGEA